MYLKGIISFIFLNILHLIALYRVKNNKQQNFYLQKTHQSFWKKKIKLIVILSLNKLMLLKKN
jgi:hypothetical protein